MSRPSTIDCFGNGASRDEGLAGHKSHCTALKTQRDLMSAENFKKTIFSTVLA
jgi:hypothetical protein